VIAIDGRLIPEEIMKDSILIHLAAAYSSVSKRLEQKTHCSETRGFILSTFRGGAVLNQNQIAVLLNFDRTVVHRVVKTLVREGLVSEKKASFGRAHLLRLTPKGRRYRASLIRERRAADEALRRKLSPRERATLLRLLKLIAALEF